jgi:hypothetical protein
VGPGFSPAWLCTFDSRAGLQPGLAIDRPAADQCAAALALALPRGRFISSTSGTMLKKTIAISWKIDTNATIVA